MNRTYFFLLLPGLGGLIAGIVITSFGLGDSPLAGLYRSLPEFELWRGIIVVQVAVYTMVTAHLWESRSELDSFRVSKKEAWGVVAVTLMAIGLPNLIVPLESFPLPGQSVRTVLVLAVAVVAMLLLTNQLARLHANLSAVETVVEYRRLTKVTQDLLVIAATTITLGTLGAGLLESSLTAVAEASSLYSSPLNRGHIVAYGAYFTVLLLLFFGPVFAAERAAAKRLVEVGRREAGAASPAEPKDKRLEMTLVERFASALGVLSPLLGALLTQLPI